MVWAVMGYDDFGYGAYRRKYQPLSRFALARRYAMRNPLGDSCCSSCASGGGCTGLGGVFDKLPNCAPYAMIGLGAALLLGVL